MGVVYYDANSVFMVAECKPFSFNATDTLLSPLLTSWITWKLQTVEKKRSSTKYEGQNIVLGVDWYVEPIDLEKKPFQ